MGLLFNTEGFNNYSGAAIDAANRYGVPVDLFLRQITQESKWNVDAVSPTGVRGIAQFARGTASDFGIDRMDPLQSLDAAAKYDAQLFRQFGSWDLAFAGYNAGPGNVKKYGSDFSKYPDPKQVSGYVANIMSLKPTGIALLDSALEGANRFLAESQSALGQIFGGDWLNDGILGQVLGRAPGPVSDKLKKAGDAGERNFLSPVTDWLAKIAPGLTLGVLGFVLIGGAILFLSRPIAEKAARQVAAVAT